MEYSSSSFTKALLASLEILNLNSLIFNRKVYSQGPKIVVIGGGTGLNSVLRGLKKYTDNFRVNKGNGAEIDECFLPENFKGNHKKSMNFFMPRLPKKRGTSTKFEERICIVSGINDNSASVLSLLISRCCSFQSEIRAKP